jgi:hypothetical protein
MDLVKLFDHLASAQHVQAQQPARSQPARRPVWTRDECWLVDGQPATAGELAQIEKALAGHYGTSIASALRQPAPVPQLDWSKKPWTPATCRQLLERHPDALTLWNEAARWTGEQAAAGAPAEYLTACLDALERVWQANRERMSTTT